MDDRIALFMVEGGRALAMVREHIAARQRIREANAAILREMGLGEGTECRISRLDGKLLAVRFPLGKAPEDWTKPDRKHGCSHPKKGTPWDERLRALEGYPAPEKVISEAFGVPLSISYSSGKGKKRAEGWTCIGPMLTACGWLYMSADGPYAMWIPDVAAAVAKLESEGYTVSEPGKSFRLNVKGCRRILQEEWDLLVAQHKLQRAKSREAVAA